MQGCLPYNFDLYKTQWMYAYNEANNRETRFMSMNPENKPLPYFHTDANSSGTPVAYYVGVMSDSTEFNFAGIPSALANDTYSTPKYEWYYDATINETTNKLRFMYPAEIYTNSGSRNVLTWQK